jgi:hypothetical protein
MGGVCGVPPHKHPLNLLFEGIRCQKKVICNRPDFLIESDSEIDWLAETAGISVSPTSFSIVRDEPLRGQVSGSSLDEASKVYEIAEALKHFCNLDMRQLCYTILSIVI